MAESKVHHILNALEAEKSDPAICHAQDMINLTLDAAIRIVTEHLAGGEAEEIARLKAENERLLEALWFYATAWVTDCVGSANGQPGKRLLADKGSRARQALNPPAGEPGA